MKNKVEKFPQELAAAIKETENRISKNLEKQHKHQMDLNLREIEGERKLNQLTIASLQSKIKEQESFIKQLTQKADSATDQVQSIALKALERSSIPRFHHSHEETKKQTPAS